MRTLPQAEPHLDESEAEEVFGALLDGEAGDEEIARFLSELSDRGETADEIAGAARALRARLIPIDAPADAIDVCGTGGDGHHTLNVSTAVSLVVAACRRAGRQARQPRGQQQGGRAPIRSKRSGSTWRPREEPPRSRWQSSAFASCSRSTTTRRCDAFSRSVSGSAGARSST